MKGQIKPRLNLKYCSPHFWNSHVTDTKISIFCRNDFITFVQIWFEESRWGVSFLEPFICQKIEFSEYKLEVLQSTFLKWSREWSGLFICQMVELANIKLEVLRSTSLSWSRDLYQNIRILKKLLHNFLSKFHFNLRYKGIRF